MGCGIRRWLLLAIAVTIAGPSGTFWPTLALAQAQQDWRAEFDDICSKTQDAMTLSDDELKGLVARCDKLKPAIDALSESQAKVFSRRLRSCRELYQFMLDTRANR